MNIGNGQLLQALMARRGGQAPMGQGAPASPPAMGGQAPGVGQGQLLQAMMQRRVAQPGGGMPGGRVINQRRPQPPQQMAPIAPKPMQQDMPREMGGMGPAGY
jgi:hypothetical protein